MLAKPQTDRKSDLHKAGPFPSYPPYPYGYPGDPYGAYGAGAGAVYGGSGYGQVNIQIPQCVASSILVLANVFCSSFP